MINSKYLDKLIFFKPDEQVKHKKLLVPKYDQYSFALIPETIKFLLTREKQGLILSQDCFAGQYPQPKKIVLFLIDALGWRYWSNDKKIPIQMKKVKESNDITPISTLFPSTTAASITTISTGKLPAAHGLFDYHMYFPEYQQNIQSLLFSPEGPKKRNLCLERGCDPKNLLLKTAWPSFYSQLARAGVKSYKVQPQEYSGSTYDNLLAKDVEVLGYQELGQGLELVKKCLSEQDETSFIYYYFPEVDSLGHQYGPDNDRVWQKIHQWWQVFEQIFSLSTPANDVLFLLTADHGMTAVDPKTTFYLNREIPQLQSWLQVTDKQKLILPAGLARDVFLHVKPEFLAATLKILKNKLAKIAKVMLVEEALKLGLFGSQPVSLEFKQRLGDILILPYQGQTVWWDEPGIMEMPHHGLHGGLSTEEAVTQLVVI